MQNKFPWQFDEEYSVQKYLPVNICCEIMVTALVVLSLDIGIQIPDQNILIANHISETQKFDFDAIVLKLHTCIHTL